MIVRICYIISAQYQIGCHGYSIFRGLNMDLKPWL